MEAQPVEGVLLTAPTDAAGEAPVGSGPRFPLRILFLALCIGSGMLLHAEELAAAAAAEHLCSSAAVVIVFSVTALFNLAIFSLNFLMARGRAAGAGGPRQQQLLRPTGRSGPVGSGPRFSLRILFLALCICSGMLLHAEEVAAAAAEHLCPSAAAAVVFSVTALFYLAIFSLNFLMTRGRAASAGGPRQLLLRPTARSGAAPAVSVSKSLLVPFIGLCLAMGAALHAKSLAAAAAEYQIDPAVVGCVALAGVALFHLAVLSIHKTLASHGGQDGLKQGPRSRGLPLLPFVILALAISAASSVETVMADGATDLPQDASVWAALALTVSFNIAIGSLYCFIIAGPPPPTAATVDPRSRIKSAGAMVSCITAAGIVSFLLLASGGASGAIAARS